jgi:hypothetical protein
MSDKKTENAPYMGVVKVGRISGQVELFDSDVTHQHFIGLEICHAETERHLSQNWVHGGKEIIRVYMSEIQWAQLLSSMNQGDGVSCTLNHIEGKRIAPPPRAKSIASTFHKEIVETAEDSLNAIKSAISTVEKAFEPKAKALNKTELAAVLSNLQTAVREFENNLPFVEKQFTEAMETKMSEAKSSFEGYVNNRLRSLGLETAALQAATDAAPQPNFLTDNNEADADEATFNFGNGIVSAYGE